MNPSCGNRSDRRVFLRSLSLLWAGSLLPKSLWARALCARGQRVLVVVFLRGGADTLNLVVPYTDPFYRAARPTIALSPPGDKDGVLDLNGRFGLHPALAPLRPWFQKKRLALVQAVGHPGATRSHFEEQDVWETGLVKNTLRSAGWLNRHLANVPAKGPVRGLSLGPALTRSLRGVVPTQALNALEDLSLDSGREKPEAQEQLLSHLYRQAGGSLGQTGLEALAALQQLSKLGREPYQPRGGIRYPSHPFGRHLKDAARLIKARAGVEVITTDLGGFDTHQKQGGAKGHQARLAAIFAQGLDAFGRDLGPDLERVLLLAVSEFGRTFRENGTGGTDHGRASVVWLLGGDVLGGKLHGRWPGLSPKELWKKRELQFTTDFRDILWDVLEHHLGNRQVQKVLPDHAHKPTDLFATVSRAVRGR